MYIADTLRCHLESHNLLHPLQSGFRRGHSTQSLLLYLTDSWYKSLDKGHLVGAVFLDISKAFDTINHNLLLLKLKSQFQLSDSLCHLLRSYLSERYQAVSANGSTSNYVSVLSGVPQGSILGPILFSMFINDLPRSVQPSVTTALFADDSTFFVSGDNITDIESNLNSAMASINSWMFANGLRVNLLKSKCMLIHSSRKKPPPLSVSFNNCPIQQVTCFKLLGVMIDHNLTWSTHIAHILRSVTQNLHLLRRISWLLPRNARLAFYFAYIAPHFNYCSLVWDSCCSGDSKRLQLAHNYAARLILKLPRFSSASDARSTLGWSTLEQLRRRELIKLFQSSLPGSNKPLPPYLDQLLIRTSDSHDHVTRASTNGSYKIRPVRTNFGKQSISYRLSHLSHSYF